MVGVEWLPLLKWLGEAGVPISLAAMVVLFMWTMDRRLSSRQASSDKEATRLSEDEDKFRKHLLDDITQLRTHINDLYSKLQESEKKYVGLYSTFLTMERKHQDCTDELAELQERVSRVERPRSR